MSFTGFPEEAFKFLVGLKEDNSRAYWQEHNEVWQEVIRPTMRSLMDELEPFFGPLRMYRPNRDIRFSRNKDPYKTWVGITTQGTGPGGIGLFFAIEPRSMRISAGSGAFAADQIKEYRRSLDNPVAGPNFERIVSGIIQAGYKVTSGRRPELVRMPRGYDQDHPRATYLKWRGVVLRHQKAYESWFGTPVILDHIIRTWSTGLPLIEWIQEFVGTTQMKRR